MIQPKHRMISFALLHIRLWKILLFAQVNMRIFSINEHIVLISTKYHFFLDGYSYERSAIESWFQSGKLTSPMTNQLLPSVKVRPNIALKERIDNYLLSH